VITTHYVYRDDGVFWSGTSWNISATWTTYNLTSIIYIQDGKIYINYNSIPDIPNNNAEYEIHAIYWNSTDTNSYRWVDTAESTGASTSTTSTNIPSFSISIIFISIGISMINYFCRKRFSSKNKILESIFA